MRRAHARQRRKLRVISSFLSLSFTVLHMVVLASVPSIRAEGADRATVLLVDDLRRCREEDEDEGAHEIGAQLCNHHTQHVACPSSATGTTLFTIRFQFSAFKATCHNYKKENTNKGIVALSQRSITRIHIIWTTKQLHTYYKPDRGRLKLGTKYSRHTACTWRLAMTTTS
jgi:hypothetical protein